MSVTVQTIINQCCFDLLEPNPPGLLSGTVTQQQLLDYLNATLADFLSRTEIVKSIFTQQASAGVSQYEIPDQQTSVDSVFVNAKILEQVDLLSSYALGQWQRHPKTPLAWHEDGLPVSTIELLPAPNWNGSSFAPVNIAPPGTYGTFQPGNRNLTTVAGTLASKNQFLIGDTLDTIPDSFTPYLVFGILERVFSTDGETKDNQRALYCRSRFEEGVIVARSILWEFLDENKLGIAG